MRTAITLLLVATSPALVAPVAAAQAECDPQVLTSPTHFPTRSQVRGQEGTVFLEVRVDGSGRVSETQLLRSSGHGLLDRAAAASVRHGWVFDVSACERKDLPASDLITVEYRYDNAQ